jgi:hypothetical protein
MQFAEPPRFAFYTLFGGCRWLRWFVTNLFSALEFTILFCLMFVPPILVMIASSPLFCGVGIVSTVFFIPSLLAAGCAMVCKGCKRVNFKMKDNDFCLLAAAGIPYFINLALGATFALVYAVYIFAVSAAWFAVALPLLILGQILLLPLNAANAVYKCMYPNEDYIPPERHGRWDWLLPVGVVLFRPLAFFSNLLNTIFGGDDD